MKIQAPVALYSCAPISNHKLSQDVTSEYVNGDVGYVLFSGRGGHSLSSCFCKQLDANRAFADYGLTQEWPPIAQ